MGQTKLALDSIGGQKCLKHSQQWSRCNGAIRSQEEA